MKLNNLLACLMIASVLISISSTAAFAQEIINCVEAEKSITVYYDDGSTQIFTDKCGYDSGSGQYGSQHYFCGTTSGGKSHYWINFTACDNCVDGACQLINCTGMTWQNCQTNIKHCWWSTCGCLNQGQICDKIPCEDLTQAECTEGYYGGFCKWSDICGCMIKQEACEAEIPVPCYGVYCRDEYTCIKSAYQVCLLKSTVPECSEIDGPVYENCYVYNYYQAPMIEYLTDYNGNKFMISELSGEDVKIKAIDPDTNAVLEYWISTTERKAVLSGKNTMIITIDSIFYDLNPPFGSKDRVSLRVETPTSTTPIEGEETVPITQPIVVEAVCEEGPCIYGIYATLGEMFKLQETQPVKIIDYLDSNNNPLKITFVNVQKPNNAITLRLDFNDENVYMEPVVGESMTFFGATIRFISIDDSWEYATLQVTSDETSARAAGAQIAVRATVATAVTTLETVKAKAPEQATGVVTAQEKILEINKEAENVTREIDQRGFGYALSWFFGMAAEQEKDDAAFFSKQASQLNETAQLLMQIAEQVGEPAKTVLVEQATKLQEQSDEFLQKAEEKEKNAEGLFSWFGLR